MFTAFLLFGHLAPTAQRSSLLLRHQFLTETTGKQGIPSDCSPSPRLISAITSHSLLHTWISPWIDQHCGVGSRFFSGLGHLGNQTDNLVFPLERWVQFATSPDNNWWQSPCDHSPHCGVGSRLRIGQGSGTHLLVQGVGSQYLFFTGLISPSCTCSTKFHTTAQRWSTRTLTNCWTHQLAPHWINRLHFWNFINFWTPFINITEAPVTHCGVGSRYRLTGHCDTCPILELWYQQTIVQQLTTTTVKAATPFLQVLECCYHTGICETHLSSWSLHPELNWCVTDALTCKEDIGPSSNWEHRRLSLALLALGHVGVLYFIQFFAPQHWHNFAFLIDVDRKTRTLPQCLKALTATTTSESALKRGIPGPKSRDRPKRPSCSLLRIFHCASVFMLPHVLPHWSIRGEGCAPVMGGAEVPLESQSAFGFADGAKQHDTRPKTGDHAIHWHPKQTRVVKRSIKRAYARACAQGLAWYKGKCYTPNEFTKNLPLPVLSPALQTKPGGNPAITACNRKHRDARRMSPADLEHRWTELSQAG